MTSIEFPRPVRFRPECEHDAQILLAGASPEMRERIVLLNPEPGPNSNAAFHAIGEMIYEIEIRSGEDLADLLRSMAAVPDGHRMLQTIDDAATFSGEAYEETDDRTRRIVSMLPEGAESIRDVYLENSGNDGVDYLNADLATPTVAPSP